MTGEQLYDMYREERIQQGWQEFFWKSMSKTQQLVWEKLASRIQNAQPPAKASKIAASIMPFGKKTPGGI